MSITSDTQTSIEIIDLETIVYAKINWCTMTYIICIRIINNMHEIYAPDIKNDTKINKHWYANKGNNAFDITN